MFTSHRTRSSLRVFGGSSHPELTRLVARKVGVRVGEVKLSKFANRETNVQLLENIRGQDVYVIQTGGGISPNDNLMELLLLINAFRLSAAGEITVITPFYPYSKGDQKDGNRVPISSKLVADMLKKAGATFVMMLDPHTPQLEGFFDMPVDMLKVEPLYCEWIKKNVPNWEDSVIVSPDEGGAKRAISVANDLRLEFALIHNRNKPREEKRAKKYSRISSYADIEDKINTIPLNLEDLDDEQKRYRRSSSRTSGTVEKKFGCLSGNVFGKRVIVVDDMIDTGKTAKFAAEVLHQEGASELYIMATHGIFSQGSIDIIDEFPDGFLKAIVISNSIPQDINKSLLTDRFHVIDVSGLIAEFIRRHHYRESVSVLSQFMPIRDETRAIVNDPEAVLPPHHNPHLAPELLRGMNLDDQGPSDPEAVKNTENQDEEDGQSSTVDSNDGLLHPNTQRLRKGFRLSSMCWD